MENSTMWIAALSVIFAAVPVCVTGGEILLIVDGDNVIRSDTWGPQLNYSLDYVLTGVEGIVDLDFDLISDTLYWTTSSQIQKAYIGGEADPSSVQVEDFVTSGITDLDSLAVDWLHRMLYWTDRGRGEISMIGLNGSGRKVVVTGISNPHRIVVDPEKGQLYWIDRGSASAVKLESSSLDGTGRKDLLIHQLTTPTALAIDYSVPRMIYWADTGLNSIQTSRVSGWSREVVISSQTLYNNETAVRSTESLTLGSQYIYWAEPDRQLILYTSKTGHNKVKALPGNFVQPTSVHVFHDYRQPVDKCSFTGGCAADVHLCTDDPSGPYLCSCGPGTEYSEEEQKCVNVNECQIGIDDCHHICTDNNGSYSCACVSGYQLSNGTLCEDFDECDTDEHECEQICNNVIGSYTCNCEAGYKLQSDGLKCKLITCDDPLTYPNVLVDCGTGPHPPGHTCTLACSSGSLFGPTTVFCGQDGDWVEPSETPFCYGSSDEIVWGSLGIEVTPGAVAENSPLNTTVGTIALKVPEVYGQLSLQSLEFSLVSTGVPFVVDNTTTPEAMLLLNGPVNHEQQDFYEIILKAELQYNTEKHMVTSEVKIYIGDVNEPPSVPQLSRYSVPETLRRGGIVARFITTDPDRSTVDPTKMQKLDYFLLDATDSKGKSVEIFDDQDDLGIALWGKLNHEQSPFYTLTIKVQDTGTPPLSATAVVNITVSDVNERPTDILLSNTSMFELTPFDEGSGSTPTASVMIGTLTVIDPDDPVTEEHTYKVIKDDIYDHYIDCFSIINTTLNNGTNVMALFTNNPACFDYEKSPLLQTTLEVQDKHGLTFQKSFDITIKDKNEKPTDIFLTASRVLEHSPIGMVIGMVFVRDPDLGDQHTVSLLQSTNNWLTLSGTSLKISGDIDYEQHRTIEVTFQATDKLGLQLTKSVTVMVENAKHGPEIMVNILEEYQCEGDTELSACVPEDVPGDTEIATVTTVDTEENKTVAMWLTDSTGSIQISVGSIIVKKKKLNYESIRSLVVKLTAIDQQGDMTELRLNVKVLDVNERPKVVRLSGTILHPAAVVGDIVGSLTCVDQDLSDRHSFNLTSNPGELFIVEENKLKIAKAPIGIEFPISLTCSDGNLTSKTTHFTLEKSTDDGADILISLSQTQVLESAASGTTIGTISISSDESLNMFHITLENGEFLPFKTTARSSTSAALQLNAELDYENEMEYEIVIKALSQITLGIAFQNFTIQVVNVPEDIEIDVVLLKESPAGTWVSEITVLDPSPDTQYTFTIIECALPLELTDATATSARLTTSDILDYEDEDMGQGKEFDLTIEVTDPSQPLIRERRTYTLKIRNVNEAPYNVTLSSWVVLENTAPQSVVSRLIVHDPDEPVTKQKFYCDFIQNDFGWFYIDNSLNLKVVKDAVIDYEHSGFPVNKELHVDHLVFECWDQAGLSFVSEPLQLEIRDVNEPPTGIKNTETKLSVMENLPPGTRQYISRFTVDDEDENENHTLVVEPRNEKHLFPPGLFVIVGHTLFVTDSLNFENRSSYKVKVTAYDKGGLTFVKKKSINVVDMNDPPTRVYVSSSAYILENPPAGAMLTYLYTEDEDFDQGHVYTLLSQSPPNGLQVINNRLAVLSPDVLDYERYKLVSLTIKSTDKGSPSLSVTNNITIPIEDVHEAPTGLILNSNQVNEGALKGTVVGNITMVDPDGDLYDPFYYFIFLTDSAGGRFHVQYSWDLGTHQLLVSSGGDTLNYEEQSTHNITLYTIDYEHSLTVTVTIHVMDQNDPPKGLLFEAPPTGGDMPSEPDVNEFPSMSQNDISPTVVLPESTGLSVAATSPLAYVYVVDEDMLQDSVNMNDYRFTISADPPQSHTGSRRRREANGRIRRQSDPAFTSPDVSSFSLQTEPGSRWLALWSSLTLDYEAQSQYEFYITCIDTSATDMSITQKVTLMVKNIEEPPYSVTLESNTVKENNDRSIKIGTLSVLDQDQAPVYMSSVMQTPSSPFYTSGLDLYSNRVFDYEAQSTYSLNISITQVSVSLATPSYYSLQVSILDEPEPPCCLSFVDNGLSRKLIPSSIAIDDTVGMLSVDDPDLIDRNHVFTFEVRSVAYQTNDYTAYFKVINQNQLIVAQQLPDTSSRAVYEILIRTQDSSGLGYKQRVYVSFLGGCDGLQCHTSATCVKLDNGTSTCQCNRGYSGSGEQCTAINACEKNPCQNGGECFHGSHGSYICNCSAEFTGLNCEVSRSMCEGVRCPHGGVCVPLQKSHTCQCKEPYTRDCSKCIKGKLDGDVCQPPLETPNSGEAQEDRPSSRWRLPNYAVVIIALVAGLFLVILIVAVVVYMRRRRRHLNVHSRMRYNSEGSNNLNIISGDLNFKDGAEPSQFANPLYDRASISAGSEIYPSDSKVPVDDNDPNTVNLDMNENPPEVTRTLSQQEEILFHEGRESSS